MANRAFGAYRNTLDKVRVSATIIRAPDKLARCAERGERAAQPPFNLETAHDRLDAPESP